MTVNRVLPSVQLKYIDTRTQAYYEAQYSAWTFSSKRFIYIMLPLALYDSGLVWEVNPSK